MIEWIVGLLYQLLQDLIEVVLINAALIVVRLCHCWVRISWVDPSANHTVDIVYLIGLGFRRGKTNIRVQMTKYISACFINRRINVCCIAVMMCSTSWTKLWRDPELSCFPGWHSVVDVRCSEGNECLVDIINQWYFFHSHLLYAIEVCPVNKIHNFSRCKSKLALLNWSSRQRVIEKGTSNLPHQRWWGMQMWPWPIARRQFSRSLWATVYEIGK